MSGKKQLKKFREAARKAECDESPEAFERALKSVAKKLELSQKGRQDSANSGDDC